MREGDFSYPASCLEIKYRGFNKNKVYPSGFYEIQPNNEVIETYCEMDRHGGGWTLVTKASTRTGWDIDKSVLRNEKDASKADYSIFKYVDYLKHKDPAEVGHGSCLNVFFFENTSLLYSLCNFSISINNFGC